MSGCDCLTHRQAELEESIFLWTWWTRSCCRPLQLWEGKQASLYLLSDHVGVVTSLDFEGAVVCPEVDRVGDTSNTPFIDLHLMLATWAAPINLREPLTNSAASVPAIENSRSAYFFQ